MAAKDLSPARLEAISDGIIAIIITIMVLDLHPPRDARPASLLALWPEFVSYALSFDFVAIYWVNHRYIFKHIKAVDDRILWSNMLLLFLLSLIPFATAYMGESHMARFPTAIYAAEMVVCGVAFWNLHTAIAAHVDDPAELDILTGPRARLLNGAAQLGYLLAVGAAFIHPALSLAMNFGLSVFYMTPLARPEVDS